MKFMESGPSVVRRLIPAAALTLCLVMTQVAIAQNQSWKDYGGSASNSHYVVTDALNKSNVSQLQVAWSFPTPDNNVYQFNPIVVDNTMYVLGRESSLVALDATTGKQLWVHEKLTGIARRGINYWESKDRKDRRLIFQINNTLQAIDAQTGKSILSFGNQGIVNLREGLGRDPKMVYRVQSGNPGKIFENLLILGSATGEGYFSTPGFFRAFDVRTGKLAWTFHTIPQPGEFGYNTWPKDAYKYIGGVNTWGEITVDDKNGIAFFPTGSATYDYYGADRIGSNLFANCLIALDARTGKRLWHFQFTHHDLWDYDAPAAPQLMSVHQEGKQIEAVALATKQGFVFAFDRRSGKPLFPIEERPVPKSDMPEEQAWPTQPFPTAPPPFARQTLTTEDINPYILTREEREKWKDIIANSRNEGLYTPPTTRDTVAIPGARGGANWGSTSANPVNGILYVASHDFPSIYRLSLEQPGAAAAAAAARSANAGPGQTLYAQTCAACHGADRSGMGGAIPSLRGVVQRLGRDDVREVIAGGRGQMPAFTELNDQQLTDIITYLATADSGGPAPSAADQEPGLVGAQQNNQPPPAWTAPVVQSGPVPETAELKANSPDGPSEFRGMGGPPYPGGIPTPKDRYYTGYNIIRHIVAPPWSTLTAYDLNKGTIKWRIPLGEDVRAVAEGVRNTGTMLEHKAPIVTSTGLVILPARDGKIRAYDAENGETLWTADLPAGSAGIPTYYEIDGRAFLTVVASVATPQLGLPETGTGGGSVSPAKPNDSGLQKGYVTFALPAKAKPGAISQRN